MAVAEQPRRRPARLSRRRGYGHLGRRGGAPGARDRAGRQPVEQLDALAGRDPHLRIDDLHAGYGQMEILHGFNLRVGRGQSLCLIGPNGAGKSTVLHSIFGFTNIFSGSIATDQDGATARCDAPVVQREASLGRHRLHPAGQIRVSRHDGGRESLDGRLPDGPHGEAKLAAERCSTSYPRLAARRKHPAKVLSGGERRLLEISRALVMDPQVLLVDEPSIGLEPRFIDMVFEILGDLQHKEGKTIVMVEQNAKKGLEFADIGYVLVSGELALAGGEGFARRPDVGRLFLGG